jgi:hypothetical protein
MPGVYAMKLYKVRLTMPSAIEERYIPASSLHTALSRVTTKDLGRGDRMIVEVERVR